MLQCSLTCGGPEAECDLTGTTSWVRSASCMKTRSLSASLRYQLTLVERLHATNALPTFDAVNFVHLFDMLCLAVRTDSCGAGPSILVTSLREKQRMLALAKQSKSLLERLDKPDLHKKRLICGRLEMSLSDYNGT